MISIGEDDSKRSIRKDDAAEIRDQVEKLMLSEDRKYTWDSRI